MLAIIHGDSKDKYDTFFDIRVSVHSAVQFFTRWVVVATFLTAVVSCFIRHYVSFAGDK